LARAEPDFAGKNILELDGVLALDRDGEPKKDAGIKEG
jgi:hypothetical protein